MSEPVLCRDCAKVRPHPTQIFSTCGDARANISGVALRSCLDVRSNELACGPEGEWFEVGPLSNSEERK